MADTRKSAVRRRLIVAGCLVDGYRGDIQKDMPGSRRVIGTNELGRIVAMCEGLTVESNPLEPYLYHDLTPRGARDSQTYAYIKIAEGCDHPAPSA